jgi:hypothetical protein
MATATPAASASAAAGADLERLIRTGFGATGGILAVGAIVASLRQARIDECCCRLGRTRSGSDDACECRETECIAQEFSAVHGEASVSIGSRSQVCVDAKGSCAHADRSKNADTVAAMPNGRSVSTSAAVGRFVSNDICGAERCADAACRQA